MVKFAFLLSSLLVPLLSSWEPPRHLSTLRRLKSLPHLNTLRHLKPRTNTSTEDVRQLP